jgi:hypothetical protein
MRKEGASLNSKIALCLKYANEQLDPNILFDNTATSSAKLNGEDHA